MSVSTIRTIASAAVAVLFLPSFSDGQELPDANAAEMIQRCVEARLQGNLSGMRSLLADVAKRLPRSPEVSKHQLRFDGLRADLRTIEALQSQDLTNAKTQAKRNYEQAKRNLGAGDLVAVCVALTYIECLKASKDDKAADAVTLECAAGALSAAAPDSREAVVGQQLLLNRFWAPIAKDIRRSVEKKRPLAEVEAAASRSLASIQQRLTQAGVPEAISSFGWIVLAQLQFNFQRLDQCAETLARIRPHAEAMLVLPSLRADFHTLSGLLDASLYNFESSRRSLEQALATRRKYELGPQLVAQSLNNLGLLCLRQGDVDAAADFLIEACEIYETQKDADKEAHAQALTNLAKVHEARRDWIEAVATHRRAVRLAKASPSSIDDIVCENNLGLYRFLTGDFDAAEETFQKLHPSIVEEFGPRHLRAAECTINRGWTAYAKRDLQAASAYFSDAAKLLADTVPDYHPRFAEAHCYLARVLADAGRLDDARAAVAVAVESQRKFLEGVMSSAISERDQLALVQGFRLHHEASSWPGLLESFFELADNLRIPASRQYEVLLFWKGVVDRHAVVYGDANADAESAALLAERSAVLEKLRAAYFSHAEPDELADKLKRINDLQAEANRIERELRSKVELQSSDRRPLQPAELSKALHEDEAFVDFFQYWPTRRSDDGTFTSVPVYLAFITRPGEGTIRLDLGGSDVIDREVTNLYRALTLGVEYSEPAKRLSELIQKPLQPHLHGVRRLILCGDGYLHRVPLAMLPVYGDEKVWLEKCSFGWAMSADALVRRRQAPPSSAAGALIVADVDYGPRQEGDAAPTRSAKGRSLADILWERLPATKEEGLAVRDVIRRHELAQPIDFLTGEQATADAVESALTNRRYIHLATHGFFDLRLFQSEVFATYDLASNYDSALIFANANLAKPGEDDQTLTAADVGRLNLGHVDLLVMAACSTGIGHVRAGQGTLGLLGSLERAGVRTTVSALWPVGDEATFHLMKLFYERCFDAKRPVGAAEALRQAQLSLLRGEVLDGKGNPMAHPMLWAGFLVSGDPAATVASPAGERRP